jgi:hypothetical protein
MRPACTHLFILRLGRRQSIGPTRLHRMWKTACGSSDISVSRQAGDADEATYLLAAHSEAVHHSAEQQMRQMLEGDGFSFRLVRTG